LKFGAFFIDTGVFSLVLILELLTLIEDPADRST